MQLYSQRDPAYDRRLLGNSNLTVHGYGCLVCSIATLYQRSPVELLDVPGAFDSTGKVFTGVLAGACGGAAGSPTTSSVVNGWQIAMTDFYAGQGYPTHFFCVNMQTNQQIDPLKFPAVIEPLKYPIKQFRPFTNTQLGGAIAQPPVFSDVAADRPTAAAIKLCKDRGLVQGYPDGTFKPAQPITREEVCVIVARLLQA